MVGTPLKVQEISFGWGVREPLDIRTLEIGDSNIRSSGGLTFGMKMVWCSTLQVGKIAVFIRNRAFAAKILQVHCQFSSQVTSYLTWRYLR